MAHLDGAAGDGVERLEGGNDLAGAEHLDRQPAVGSAAR